MLIYKQNRELSGDTPIHSRKYFYGVSPERFEEYLEKTKMEANKKILKLSANESKELVLKNEDLALVVNLDGDESSINIIGRFLLTGNTQRSINLTLNHMGINTKGRIDIKVVLCDTAKLYFNGCLVVNKKAIGTDTYLSQRNLLVGEQAFVESIPSLEIKNAKVKASHGVTIGKVNEDEIYYMKSRGLSHSDAESLITAGFLK